MLFLVNVLQQGVTHLAQRLRGIATSMNAKSLAVTTRVQFMVIAVHMHQRVIAAATRAVVHQARVVLRRVQVQRVHILSQNQRQRRDTDKESFLYI